MPLVESDWQQLSTVQGPTQPKPGTLASAATIAPITFLTILTGNVAVTTITPPIPHAHMIAVQFAGTGGVATGGNILTTTASVAGQCMLLIYNPNIAKYVPVG
jgi:hypothetical protein